MGTDTVGVRWGGALAVGHGWGILGGRRGQMVGRGGTPASGGQFGARGRAGVRTATAASALTIGGPIWALMTGEIRPTGFFRDPPHPLGAWPTIRGWIVQTSQGGRQKGDGLLITCRQTGDELTASLRRRVHKAGGFRRGLGGGWRCARSVAVASKGYRQVVCRGRVGRLVTRDALEAHDGAILSDQVRFVNPLITAVLRTI